MEVETRETIRLRRYPAAASVAVHLHHGHLAGCSIPPLSPRSRGMSSATSPVKRRRRYPKTAAVYPRPRWRLGRLLQSPRRYAALSSVCCTASLRRRTARMDGWMAASVHETERQSSVVIYRSSSGHSLNTPRCNSTPSWSGVLSKSMLFMRVRRHKYRHWHCLHTFEFNSQEPLNWKLFWSRSKLKLHKTCDIVALHYTKRNWMLYNRDLWTANMSSRMANKTIK